MRRQTILEIPKPAVGVSRWRRFRARLDWPLCLAVLSISAIGLLNLYSATHGTRHATKFDQQIVRMVIGVTAFFVVTLLDYRTLVRVAWFLLGGTVVALIAVALLGELSLAKGSQRWLTLGPARIQPSEIVKVAVILVLAKMIQEHESGDLTWKQALPRIGLLGVPIILIAMQPDLGSSIMVGMIVLSVGFLVLRRIWPAICVTCTGLALIPVLWDNMHHYQKQRVLAFLDPAADPTGAGWHTRQSIFAVGSGRLSGKGFMEGTQNQFDFLPEHWTDFPFSVLAEEWGFLGASLLLLLFGFLILWIVNAGLMARDVCGSVICVGVAAMLFWHLIVNIAMVLGMAPVVGVTLPFISYGGSSLIACFIAVGLVSSVSLRRHGF